MAMPDQRRQNSLGFTGPPGSRRTDLPPGRVQNLSHEVQVLPEPARIEGAGRSDRQVGGSFR
jgi:hypothetical protein